MIVSVLAAAAMQLSSPAGAAPVTSVVAATAVHARKDSSQQVVCHQETKLGSLIPQRVCTYKNAANQGRQDAQDTVREMQAHNPFTSELSAGPVNPFVNPSSH